MASLSGMGRFASAEAGALLDFCPQGLLEARQPGWDLEHILHSLLFFFKDGQLRYCGQLLPCVPQIQRGGPMLLQQRRRAGVEQGRAPEGLCCCLEWGTVVGLVERAVPTGKAGTLC